jgi:sec-independent protein translocase protein TatC
MGALQLGPKKDDRRNFSGDPEEYRLTLIEHLEELRDRLIKAILIIGLFWVIGWFLFPQLYAYLNGMVTGAIKPVVPDYREIFRNTTEPFMLKLKLSFTIGLVGAFPFIVLQLWAFIAPGLKPTEQKPFRRLAPLSLVLFAVGAAFAWIMVPTALRWFASFVVQYEGVGLYQDAGTMVFFVLKMLLAFGIAFQLPLVVFILGALELLSAETMLKYWRQVIAAIFVLCMLITPTQDPITMTLMAIPLVGLFLISALIVKRVQRKKREAEILEFDQDAVDAADRN